MKTEKKTQVVMLGIPFSQQNKIMINGTIELFNNKLTISKGHKESNPFERRGSEQQHLYFLSDDEIKEGDWFIGDKISLRQCTLNNGGNINFKGGWYSGSSNCKKIIVSTDKSLGLPRPSNAFIQKYVEEYNRSNIITEVIVECEQKYETISKGKPGFPEDDIDWWISNLKVNPDNTINIKPVEETWDGIFYKFTQSSRLRSILGFTDWLEENYQVPKQIK